MRVDLLWRQHQEDFASLMLGRIELAHISKGRRTGAWFWKLRFTEPGEQPSFSSPTETEARQICEEHARKVIAS